MTAPVGHARLQIDPLGLRTRQTSLIGMLQPVFLSQPILCGHDSILVLHHVYDRALLGALDRVHHQHLFLEFDQLSEDLSDEGYANLRYLTTWRSVVG